MRIVLFGYPGTGTTSVGRCLAADLGLRFIDVDERLAQEQGTGRRHLSLVHGEEYVRQAESGILVRALDEDNSVIAAGAVELPGGTTGLPDDAVVVVLTAEPAMVLFRTVGALEERTAVLRSREAIEAIRCVMREKERRLPRPRLRVDTTALTPEETARKIRSFVEEQGNL